MESKSPGMQKAHSTMDRQLHHRADPDIVVLTEYVEGRDHDSLLANLKANGLCAFSLSKQPGRENQILIASREAQRQHELIPPTIHPSVPSNVAKVSLASGITVLGFRMPAFTGKGASALKRLTWEWLLEEANQIRTDSALICGDFNTATDDSKAACGDCLQRLIQAGWQRGLAEGHSWRHPNQHTERQIDHVFLSASLLPTQAEYSWEFGRLAPEGTIKAAGYPDHAMLVCEFGRPHPLSK